MYMKGLGAHTDWSKADRRPAASLYFWGGTSLVPRPLDKRPGNLIGGYTIVMSFRGVERVVF